MFFVLLSQETIAMCKMWKFVSLGCSWMENTFSHLITPHRFKSCLPFRFLNPFLCKFMGPFLTVLCSVCWLELSLLSLNLSPETSRWPRRLFSKVVIMIIINLTIVLYIVFSLNLAKYYFSYFLYPTVVIFHNLKRLNLTAITCWSVEQCETDNKNAHVLAHVLYMCIHMHDAWWHHGATSCLKHCRIPLINSASKIKSILAQNKNVLKMRLDNIV